MSPNLAISDSYVIRSGRAGARHGMHSRLPSCATRGTAGPEITRFLLGELTITRGSHFAPLGG